MNFANFPFLSTVFVHVSNPNSVLIPSRKVLTVCICVWRSVSCLIISLKSSVLAKCDIAFVICSSYPVFNLFYCSAGGINVMKNLLLLLLLSPRNLACSTGPETSDFVALRAPFYIGYFSDAWLQR